MQNNDIDQALKKIYQADKKLLEKTQIPIMTVSAVFREDLKGLHHLKEKIKALISYFLARIIRWLWALPFKLGATK
jgi:hypothetical protein